jgi:hypothetical protein
LVSRSADPSHVLCAKVREVPSTLPLDDVLKANPNYRDLVEEARSKGLHKMLKEFQPLLDGEECPRCHTIGELVLDQIWNLGEHVRY